MKTTRYTKRSILGGVISLFIIFLGTLLLGELSGYEAKALIKKSLAGINTLCNTIYCFSIGHYFGIIINSIKH